MDGELRGTSTQGLGVSGQWQPSTKTLEATALGEHWPASGLRVAQGGGWAPSGQFQWRAPGSHKAGLVPPNGWIERPVSEGWGQRRHNDASFSAVSSLHHYLGVCARSHLERGAGMPGRYHYSSIPQQAIGILSARLYLDNRAYLQGRAMPCIHSPTLLSLSARPATCQKDAAGLPSHVHHCLVQ